MITNYFRVPLLMNLYNIHCQFFKVIKSGKYLYVDLPLEILKAQTVDVKCNQQYAKATEISMQTAS